MEESQIGNMFAMNDKKKGGKGLKIVTIIACVVAVCGIGFGVFGMMQSFQKDDQIIAMQKKLDNNDQLKNDITETNDMGTNEDDEPIVIPGLNPIYEGSSFAQIYIGTKSGAGGIGEMHISLMNGRPTCYINQREPETDNVFGKVKNTESCSILGIEGNVSKVVAVSTSKQSIYQNAMVFLMENGDVYYIDNLNWSNEYEAKKAELDKKAIDVTTVSFKPVVRFDDNTTGILEIIVI